MRLRRELRVPGGVLGSGALLVAATVSITGNFHPSQAAAVSVTFHAVADAQVQEEHPATNYGASPLQTDGGTGQRAQTMIRFTTSGLSGTVTRATLRLHSNGNPSSNGPALYATTNTWVENTVTFNNRPIIQGSAVDNVGAVSVETWVNFNATALVHGNGSFTLKLIQASTDGTGFYSRESGADAPQLIVTTDTGTVPTPSPTASHTATPTPAPTATHTATPVPTVTPAPTATHTHTPTPVPTPTTTATPTPTPPVTNRPAQAATLAYGGPGASGAAGAYAHPGGLVVAGRDNYQDQVFKGVSAGGGTVLIYLDTIINNSYGRYHGMLINASSCGPAVPLWPGNYQANQWGSLNDFRVGGVEQSKLHCVLETMVAENPHMAGWFADDLGSRSWFPDINWSSFPDKSAYYTGAVALSQTFRQVANEHGLIFIVNGTWSANDGGGYPNVAQHGNALADGGFVEHHDGEISFFGPYGCSAQWASQSAVTHGTAFMYAVTSTSAGVTEYKNSGCYAYVNQQTDYGIIPPIWGTLHPTGLPSKVAQ